jgi:hypothetical protein
METNEYATATKTLTIYPHESWFKYTSANNPLDFPTIKYCTVSKLHLPFLYGVESKDIILGGSYNL